MNNNITNSHDKLFKAVYSNKLNAVSFLENYLPEKILKVTDLDSLELCKDSFIEKNLQEFYSDMLYKVNFKTQPGFIYFLFEHKSYPDNLIHLQLLEYMLKIWKLELKQKKDSKLPVIIPLVLYHGKQKWKVKENLSSILNCPTNLLTEYIPDFKYILYDLSKYSDDEIKGTKINQITLLSFKYVFGENFIDKLPEIFALFKNQSEKKTDLQFFETLILYILSNVENITTKQLVAKVQDTLPEGKGDIIMTLAEQLINEGRGQGLEQGLEFAIDMKFGNSPDSRSAISIIRNIKNIHQLKAVQKYIKKAKTASELVRLISY
jgi:predicted transposase/invertase (TIGR01784 family)